MTFEREHLELPNQANALLLHSCCAPCSGEVMEALLASEIQFSIFFYNPNIHPLQEYEIRKQENIAFADKHHIPFIDADYDKDEWFKRIKGLEWEPERGLRCTACFDMRFERTALYAHEHGFPVICSSLGISRWKDMNQINTSGIRAASRYEGMVYWTYNWRKQGGAARMYDIAKRENFYKQEYCGCVYSLRDTNAWRKQNGRDRIKIGLNYYTEAEINALNTCPTRGPMPVKIDTDNLHAKQATLPQYPIVSASDILSTPAKSGETEARLSECTQVFLEEDV